MKESEAAELQASGLDQVLTLNESIALNEYLAKNFGFMVKSGGLSFLLLSQRTEFDIFEARSRFGASL